MTESDKLVDQHGPAVWRTIYRLLGGCEGAADCFQETFLEWARRTAKKEDAAQSRALLVHIASCRAIDTLRRRISARKRESALGSDDFADSSPSPVDDASHHELAEALRQALVRIDPAQAAVFSMTHFEQLDREMIAQALGTTANHIAVLLHRARGNLQEQLHLFANDTRR
jgi:RNA polymerase sigma-70 factor (ECF subfamily)